MKYALHAFRPLAVAFALCSFTALAQAPGDIRIALVIGNSAYVSAPALTNPANDATAMSETLRGLGFTVIEVRDGSKAQMAEAIAKVRDGLQGKQGVGMLYYAGHGLQMDARNYMVPVNAKMAKAGDVAAQTVEVGSVIEAFKAAGNRMNILVLDACRDNPFGGITSGKGLAPLDAPSGTFLAYATAPGNVAADGDAKSGNGLYTQYLLQELKNPKASIENVFKRVRFAVRKASNGKQIPWESTSLEDDFQFNDGKVVAIVKPTVQQMQADFAGEKADWERIKASVNADDFYAFVQKYPNGTLTEAAHAKLNFLNTPTMVVQGAGSDGEAAPYVPARFRLGDEFTIRDAVLQPQANVTHLRGSTRWKVGAIAGDEVTINQVTNAFSSGRTAIYTLEGAELGDSTLRHLPFSHAPTGPLRPGQRWRIGFEVQTPGVLTVVTGEGRVVAREKLSVPAGTFDTFKIARTITVGSPAYPGQSKSTKCTLWITSSLPLPIKTTCAPDGIESALGVNELMSYTRAN